METIGIDGTPHFVGDGKCSSCWTDYPKNCKCGGLLHAQFGDEHSDGNYSLFFKCDKCFSDEEDE